MNIDFSFSPIDIIDEIVLEQLLLIFLINL